MTAPTATRERCDACPSTDVTKTFRIIQSLANPLPNGETEHVTHTVRFCRECGYRFEMLARSRGIPISKAYTVGDLKMPTVSDILFALVLVLVAVAALAILMGLAWSYLAWRDLGLRLMEGTT